MNHVKYQDRKIKAILVDFDGVLRQWPDSDDVIENKYGLISGSIRNVAFEVELLNQAIRGSITDKEWRKKVVDILQTTQPDSDVPSAITEWSASHGEINRDLLALLSACKPNAEILLLTNATSRLDDDLAVLKLENWFSSVINSSEVGSVKPEPNIYQSAIEACSCSVGDIVYIDDSLLNTMAATNEGILSHHYTSVGSCKQFLLDIGLLEE